MLDATATVDALFCMNFLFYGEVKQVRQVTVHRVSTRQGKVRKIEFFSRSRIVREFCELSGKFENTGKCQGIISEFRKKSTCI